MLCALLLAGAGILNGSDVSAQEAVTDTSVVVANSEEVKLLYGKRTYDNFVGNLSWVSGEKLENYPSIQVMEALKGKLPGVFIMQNSAAPGSDDFSVNVRGAAGGYIVLIDGVERPLNSLDIEQIESIQVLKDAVSKAIYGGRTSNGIIMVTTKRGTLSKGKFTAKVQRGIKQPTQLPGYLDAYDFGMYYNQAIMNDNGGVLPDGLGYSEEDLNNYKNGLKPLQYPNVDYYGEFLNNSMDITRINTQYQGGSQNMQYYVNAGYQNEGGLETYGDHKNKVDIMSIRGNLDAKFSDDIKVLTNFWGYLSNAEQPRLFDISTLSDRYPNSYPIFVAADSVGGTPSWKDNPYGTQVQSGYSKTQIMRFQSDLGFEFNLRSIADGLKLKPYFSFDIFHQQAISKNNTVGIYQITEFDESGNALTINEIQKEKLATSQSMGDDAYMNRWAFNTTLSYEKKFGDHQLYSDIVLYMSKASTAYTLHDYKRQNIGLRANYSYKGKYNLEGVMNYCGSQSYAPGNRFKLFPAIGAGWILSKEDFMSESKVFDFLRVNATYGVMGNGNIGVNLWEETWRASGNANFSSGSSAPVYAIFNKGNKDLDWPKMSEFDINIEATMFNRLYWKTSYFNYQNFDILSRLENVAPGIVGGTSMLPQTNYGKNNLKGMELELRYSSRIKDFAYEIGVHTTYGKTEKVQIDELPDPNYTTVGDATDDIRGYRAIGTYTEQDINDMLAGNMAVPSYMDPSDMRVGNIRYEDVNGDMVIDKYDRVVIGNSEPRLMYGADLQLSYKGFKFYAQLLGIGERNIRLNNKYYQIFSTRKYSDVVRDGLPNGNPHPLLSTGQSTNDFQNSSYWITNASYLKLQNMSLSYALPQSFVNKMRMSNLEIFLYATDVLTFSKIKKLDPESLDAGVSSYPLFSTYAIGLSMSF